MSIPVFPVQHFEVDTLDPNRLVLTVHYFATSEDFAKDRSDSLKFLMPVSGVAPLIKMLNLVLSELSEKDSGTIH
jgi:hypothetical protein